MLKKARIIFTLGCLVFIANSCGYDIMARNNENLTKLKVGMTKEEVRSIMGEPLANEVYISDDAWFYFTQVKWSDGRITHDECTPVFFKDNKLVGWGQHEYKQFRQSNW